MSVNPPDKGFIVLTLDDNDTTADTQLNTAAANGYQFLAAVPHQTGNESANGTWHTRVILRQGQ